MISFNRFNLTGGATKLSGLNALRALDSVVGGNSILFQRISGGIEVVIFISGLNE